MTGGGTKEHEPIGKSQERGGVEPGRLDNRHPFSFGDYYDPAHMQWGPLRIINEDFVAPGAGFPTHLYRDMQIATQVLRGTLAQKGSTGTEAVMRPGALQLMDGRNRHTSFGLQCVR